MSTGVLSRIRPPLQPSWNVSSLRGSAAFGLVRSVNCGEKARRVITFPTEPPPAAGPIQLTLQKYHAIGVNFTIPLSSVDEMKDTARMKFHDANNLLS